MEISFLAWLIQGVPECIAMAALVESMGRNQCNKYLLQMLTLSIRV